MTEARDYVNLKINPTLKKKKTRVFSNTALGSDGQGP
jgi:hypothetical protein